MTNPKTSNFIRYIEQVRYVDEVTHVILKGHLTLEEILNRIIQKFLFHPEHIQDINLSFFIKVKLARSMSLDEHDNDMWKLILAINTLRNELAHNLDSPKRQIKLDAAKNLFFTLNKDDKETSFDKTSEDYEILLGIIAFCIGFLSTFEAEINRFRAAIDDLDKRMNPHRHKRKKTPKL